MLEPRLRLYVQQYFDIATNYGFANYMFQTNEGPSFPAHLFLFSGTSGPTAIFGQNYYTSFAAENPPQYFVNHTNTGCSSPDSQGNMDVVNGINFGGTERSTWYDPPPITWSYPCYDHNTLIDILPKHVTWKYYGPEEGSIWWAPTALKGICGKIHGGPCPNFQLNGKYYNNVSFENTNKFSTAPIFLDIEACNLAGVSWVIPDMKWSEHPGTNDNQGLGPDYVANLLDTIGESYCTNTQATAKAIGTAPPSSSSGTTGAAGTITSTRAPHPACGYTQAAQAQAGVAATPTASACPSWWSRRGPA